MKSLALALSLSVSAAVSADVVLDRQFQLALGSQSVTRVCVRTPGLLSVDARFTEQYPRGGTFPICGVYITGPEGKYKSLTGASRVRVEIPVTNLDISRGTEWQIVVRYERHEPDPTPPGSGGLVGGTAHITVPSRAAAATAMTSVAYNSTTVGVDTTTIPVGSAVLIPRESERPDFRPQRTTLVLEPDARRRFTYGGRPYNRVSISMVISDPRGRVVQMSDAWNGVAPASAVPTTSTSLVENGMDGRATVVLDPHELQPGKYELVLRAVGAVAQCKTPELSQPPFRFEHHVVIEVRSSTGPIRD